MARLRQRVAKLNPVMTAMTVDGLIAGMSEASQKMLKRMKHLSDCTVQTSDGFEFRLHKAKLTEESVVLGCAQINCLVCY